MMMSNPGAYLLRQLERFVKSEVNMELEDYIKMDINHKVGVAREYPTEGDQVMDETLVRWASQAMREKLEEAREQKGRGGWWDAERCPVEHLHSLLRAHIEKGDMVDVMNLAAMIFARELIKPI